MEGFSKASLWLIGIGAFAIGQPVAGMFTLLIAAVVTIGFGAADTVFDEATEDGNTCGQVAGLGIGVVVFAIAFAVFIAMVMTLV